MPDSQVWSDAMGLVMAIAHDELDKHAEIALKYAVRDEEHGLTFKAELVTALEAILNQLMLYVSEDFEWDYDELAQYILMEKFKRDLFDE